MDPLTVGVITGRPVAHQQVPELTRSDDGHLVSSNRKLLAESAWRPRYDVEAGLREVLAAANLGPAPEESSVVSVGDPRR